MTLQDVYKRQEFVHFKDYCIAPDGSETLVPVGQGVTCLLYTSLHIEAALVQIRHEQT